LGIPNNNLKHLLHTCPPLFELVLAFITPTRGVSHLAFAIDIKKYLKAKEELWKPKYFTMQKYNLQKIL
jgi:hypothetical protein